MVARTRLVRMDGADKEGVAPVIKLVLAPANVRTHSDFSTTKTVPKGSDSVCIAGGRTTVQNGIRVVLTPGVEPSAKPVFARVRATRR